MKRAALLILGVIMSIPLSPAQSNADSSGAPIRRLAALRPGAPVSFEQIEQHMTRSLNPNVTATVRSRVYRDSAGRVRQETEIQDAAGKVVKPDISIADPVDGSIVLLAASKGQALRVSLPISTESKTLTDSAVLRQQLGGLSLPRLESGDRSSHLRSITQCAADCSSYDMTEQPMIR